MRFSSMATLIVLVLTTTIGNAAAQETTPAAISEHQAAFRELRDSQWVRLVTPALARQEGRLLAHENDTLKLDRGPDSLLQVRAMDVDSLWVRGTSWKTGAVIGGVLGAAAGVPVGLWFSEMSCDCEEASAGTGVAGGLAGLAVGALLGSIVGALAPKWHNRWP